MNHTFPGISEGIKTPSDLLCQDRVTLSSLSSLSPHCVPLMSAHIAASVLKQTEKLKEENSIFDLAKFLCDANKTKVV